MKYLIRPYNAGPNLTPGSFNAGLHNAGFKLCGIQKGLYFRFWWEYSSKERVHAKDAIYQIWKKDNFSKTWYSLSKMAFISPATLTPTFINITRKNNADLRLGP